MNQKFEIEHWPDYFGKNTLTRLLKGYVKGILVLSAISLILLVLYYFTHISYFRWGFWGFLTVILISPFLPIVSFFQRNRKHPSYGINSKGILLNERGWNVAFFNWDEIESIKRFKHPKLGEELHFEFVSFTKAVNKKGQDKFEQSLLREYSIEKQAKRISTQLVKGDISNFIDLFEKYFQEYKEKYPIGELESFRIARDYCQNLHLPMTVDKTGQFHESFEQVKGPAFSFFIQDTSTQIVVSLIEKEVKFLIRENGILLIPHLINNPLNKKDVLEIVAKRNDAVKILKSKVYFYPNGLYEYPKPIWTVEAKVLQNTMEGSNFLTYIIDIETGQIEKTLSS